MVSAGYAEVIKQKIIELSFTKIAGEAGRKGDLLVTREAGREIAAHLTSLLLGKSADTCMILDFADVEFMDASFADEVFGNLVVARSRRQLEPRCFFLRDLNETCLFNLRACLDSRPNREDQLLRNSFVPVIVNANTIEFVGKYENHIFETFELLKKRKIITTHDVMDAFSVSMPAASTRLKGVYDLGLAIREEIRDEQGMQYKYYWPL